MHDSVADEKAAEQEHLGHQEDPHADLAGVDLLGRLGEVVLEKRLVNVFGGGRLAHAFTSSGL
jgi:hypothetical protein